MPPPSQLRNHEGATKGNCHWTHFACLDSEGMIGQTTAFVGVSKTGSGNPKLELMGAKEPWRVYHCYRCVNVLLFPAIIDNPRNTNLFSADIATKYFCMGL